VDRVVSLERQNVFLQSVIQLCYLFILFLLLTVYADAGIDLAKPVIGMCIGGLSSCTLVLTALMCGCPDAALYYVR